MGMRAASFSVQRRLRVQPPWVRTVAVPAEHPFHDRLTITEDGREVLRGATDWLSLRPPPRSVGGVRIDAGGPNWRWDEAQQEVVRR